MNQKRNSIRGSMRTSFWGVILLILSAVGLLKASEIQPEFNNVARISSQATWSFNPFSFNSWMSIPSQFMQFWFPLFQPPYRPPTAPPKTTTTTTPKPPEQNQDRHEDDNIFGMIDPPGDSVEYLPPGNEIEWD